MFTDYLNFFKTKWLMVYRSLSYLLFYLSLHFYLFIIASNSTWHTLCPFIWRSFQFFLVVGRQMARKEWIKGSLQKVISTLGIRKVYSISYSLHSVWKKFRTPVEKRHFNTTAIILIQLWVCIFILRFSAYRP